MSDEDLHIFVCLTNHFHYFPQCFIYFFILKLNKITHFSGLLILQASVIPVKQARTSQIYVACEW